MAFRFVATSRCECQATLSAELSPDHFVVTGSATRRGVRERAPAHAIGVPSERFDVGWLCPFCGRNTMRSFYAGALPRVAVDETEPRPATDPVESASAS